MDRLRIDTIETKLIDANWHYHNGLPSSLTDEEYDALCDQIKLHRPNSPVLTKIGAPITGGKTKDKVTLPFIMGSLAKTKPATENDLTVREWIAKRGLSDIARAMTYLVMAKLDGVSLQIRFVNGRAISAYTRGDGLIGGDVTYLLHFLRIPNIPVTTEVQDITLRAELLMPLATYRRKWAAIAANPRNQVAGFTTCQEFRPAMLDATVVFYEVIDSHPVNLRETKKPDELLAWISNSGLHAVDYVLLSENEILDDATLISLLEKMKESSSFELDGLVLMENIPNERPTELIPDNAVAFKVNKSVAVSVLGVEWNVSKDGLVKPRVQVEPTQLAGATVNFATGFNAKFIVDNGIGPGAIVMLARSGEVIPDITGVVMRAEPQLPADWESSFEWSPSGVDLILQDGVSHAQQDLKRLLHFTTTLGWEGWKEGVLAKIMNADAAVDAIALCEMSAEWLMANLPGVKAPLATKLVNARSKAMASVDFPTLVDASGIFGRNFGTTRASLVQKAYPDWDELVKLGHQTSMSEQYDPALVAAKVAALHGFSEITSSQFAEALPNWRTFQTRIQPHVTLAEAKSASNARLSGQVICMSGFRDAGLEQLIIDASGEVAGSLSSKVTILVVKDTTASSSKIDAARKKGVPVVSQQEFLSQYLAENT